MTVVPTPPVPLPDMVACHTCDLLQQSIPLTPGGAALCARCGAPLYRTGHVERALALTLAALVVFVIASAFPIATIETQGRYNAASLPGAVRILWNAEMHLLALLVFATTLLVPFLELLLLAVILGALHSGRHAPVSRPIHLMLRMITGTRPWGMVEVFMLGVLVSLVKLAHLAHVVPGIALWSYGVLMLLLAAIWSNVEGRELWAIAARRAAA